MGHEGTNGRRPSHGVEIHGPQIVCSLRICGTDLWLYETVEPVGRGRQWCRCDAPKEPKTWEGWDYAEAYRLCDGCGQRLLQSGSRFSVWFCRYCLEECNRIRDAVGRTVVPIARHSLMHPDVGLCSGDQLDGHMLRQFIDSLFALGDRIDHLGAWKDAWLRFLYDAVAQSEETSLPLGVFLRRVQALDPAVFGQRPGVRGMLVWFGVIDLGDGQIRVSEELPQRDGGPPLPRSRRRGWAIERTQAPATGRLEPGDASAGKVE